MKIRMGRNTRKKTATFSFRAENDTEGVALKNAVLAVGAEEGAHAGTFLLRMVEELRKNGVEDADFDLVAVEPERKSAPKGGAV